MLLNVRIVEHIMEQFAPVKLKEEYDNVGLMVGNKDACITKILIALDCTLDVINEAKNSGCNLILTHHPLIFSRPRAITNDSLTGKKIMELIKNDINVYSSHTNLDSVQGGLNDIVTEILGFSEYSIIEPSKIYNGMPSGIGRLVVLNEPIKLIDLCENVKRTLNAKFIRYVGHEENFIKTIAIVNGSGEDFFYVSKTLGADCIITGDTKYHNVSDLKEENIALIDAGHFATEWVPLQIFGEKLRRKLKEYGYDNEIIISKNTEDPYKMM